MNERRTSFRHLIHLNVVLYHSEFGPIDGSIRDVSSGGMNVSVVTKISLNKKLSKEILQVKPENMDVLFNMECLRIDGNCISLRFKD